MGRRRHWKLTIADLEAVLRARLAAARETDELSRPITGQLLEAIPGWHPEILDRFRGVEEHQLAQCDSPQVRRELPDRFASEQPLRLAVPEAPDHRWASLTRGDHNGKRYGVA